MATAHRDRFVRIPSELLEVLFRAHFSGLQFRIVLWVTRNTFGWNRSSAPFTWYRLAKDLNANRGTVFRAGMRLAERRVIRCASRRVGVEPDLASWVGMPWSARTAADEQRYISGEGMSEKQPTSLPASNESGTSEQHFSVERKIDVKTERQRRRQGGYVENLPDDQILRDLLDFYGALTGQALSPEQTVHLHEQFGQSAKALLQACSGNLDEAKAVLRKSLILNQPEP
jgi:phage replication O-like protein O